MLVNPFVPHLPAPPRAFVNREREVDLIFDHLTAAQRGRVAVHGPLGIGKTSLLQYIADSSVAADYGVGGPRYALVYVDLHAITPFSAERFWRRVPRLAARLPGTDLEPLIAPLLGPAVVDTLAVEQLLDGLEQRGQTLVLLLDEFEWALQHETTEERLASRNFLAQLGALMQRSPRALALVVATEEPLAQVVAAVTLGGGPHFASRFTPMCLTPFTRSDMDRFLDRLLADSELTLREEERTMLYSLSRGQPDALQTAAFSVFEGLQQGDGARPGMAPGTQAAMVLGLLKGGLARPWMPLATPARSRENGHSNGQPSLGQHGDGRGLWLDPTSGEVVVEGHSTPDLTPLEYRLLSLLYARPRQVLDKRGIMQVIWGEDFLDDLLDEMNSTRLEKLVSRVRRKVEPDPDRPRYLRTARGRGYRLDP